MLYFKSVAMMMHDVSNNLTPPNIFNLFTHQTDIHPYETRSSQRDYFLKRSRIDIQKRSFSRIGIAYLVKSARCQNLTSKIMLKISSSKDC